MECLFVLKPLSRTQRATKICGDLPETTPLTTAFKSYATNQFPTYPRSAFSQRSGRGYPTIVDNIRPCPKRCLLMPLARVVARTESTTLQLHVRRSQFPRTRIGTVQNNMQYAPRVLQLILFLRALKLAIFLNSPKFAKIITRF